MKNTLLGICLIMAVLLPVQSAKAQDKAYLFSYFDNVHEAAGLCLAYSYDGFHWTALNNNQPVLHPTVGKDRLLRDPSICQGPDGTFHMVWTSSWTDQIIGYASSKDLINWSEQKAIGVMMHEKRARNSWAPELFYDRKTKKFWIFWASTVPGADSVSTDGCLSEDDYNHRIYACHTKDFKKFSKTKLWYNPDFNAIDAAVIEDPADGSLIMAVKNENLHPAQKNIRITRATSMRKGFDKKVSAPIYDKDWCEGPSPVFIGDDLVIYYDKYLRHQYGASISHDHGKTWEDCSDRISMPENMSHGTIFKVDSSIVENLKKTY